MESGFLASLGMLLALATIVDSQRPDSGACYRQYIPSRIGFPTARCRYPMGGNPVTMGVFIRNDRTCCRRRQANGWGNENNCWSCSSIRGTLYPWGQWSSCSKTCGWGEQKRHRTCSNAVCAGVRGRRKSEIRACIWKACCPVDGNWGDWSHWSGCSATCGEGLQYRTRSCSSPSPSCGGKPCRSYPRQMQRCRVGQCASWSSWTSAGPCSVTCGIGNMQRTRACHGPLGDACDGEPVEHLTCDRGSCAVDGGWCSWSPWSSCTSTCKQTSGTRKKSRRCECPVPHNSGLECFGSDGEVEKCSSEVNCPVNGGWSDWSSWGECSSEKCSTSPGVRIRTRKCNNPLPNFGGTCEGQSAEENSCVNIDKCLIEGVYGEWSPWFPCTSTCGSCGERVRERECVHSLSSFTTDVIGIPVYFCDGSKEMETEKCELEPCPDGSDGCWVDDDFSADYGSSLYDGQSPHDNEDPDNEEINSPLNYTDDTEERGSDVTGVVMNSRIGEILPSSLHLSKSQANEEHFPSLYMFAEEEGEEITLNGHYGLKDPEDDSDFSGGETHNDGEISTDNFGSGIENTETEDQESSCDKLDSITGEDAERAVGCCDLLKKNITNDTDPVRLQECFALHYEYVIEDAGSIEVPPPGRTFYPLCRYRKKPKHLQTICCLYKRCSNWGKSALRTQCSACRGRQLCNSCSFIILN